MLHAPTRQSIACFGAVHLDTGKFVHAFSDPFDAQTFREFLGQLLRHRSRNKRMVVILDNARYHHAKLLKDFLEKHRQTLTLLFLPPYSPQLAPIERVWKLARRIATHNQHFPDLNSLISAVGGCFQGWRKSNATLQRLCCIN
jgi:transposase